MREILLATGNPGKLRELQELCQGLPLRLHHPSELPGGLPEVEEDRESFLDNAVKKALSAAAAARAAFGSEAWALADDSGLCVEALEGAPGVRSARFAPGLSGLPRSECDVLNNRHLLRLLDGLPADRRRAAFWCVIAVARAEELLFAVEGSVSGRILDAPDGARGFGYDPLFFHEPSGCSFAHLAPAAKTAVSHRGAAMARLRRVLEQVLDPAGT